MKVRKKIGSGLLVAAMISVLCTVRPVQAAGQDMSDISKYCQETELSYSGSSYVDYDYSYDVLSLINKQRKAIGLTELKMDKSLMKTADIRVKELVKRFDHVRPDGTSCFTAYEKGGSRGENIAYGQSTPTIVMNDWMNSSGHRSNILKPTYRSVGIGCYCYEGRYYWVQCFSSDAPDAVSINDVVASSSFGNITPKVSKVSTVKARSGVKRLAVSWTSVKRAKGYQIQISTNDKFTKGSKTQHTLKGTNNTEITLTKLLGKSLKSNKRYYIRVRAYRYGKKNGKTMKVYGKWNRIYKTTK